MSKKKDNTENIDRFFYEKKALSDGYRVIAGIDEAGRGPLAGPVVAGCVVVKDNNFTERIDDSKKLTEKMRERAFVEILSKCDVGIGVVSVRDIDRLNIFNATLLAMKRAIEELDQEPEFLLIDGRMDVPVPQPRTYLIRGEELSFSIASASIVAKVFRDRMMLEIDKKYPRYGFSKHKGYGTKLHIDAIREYGLSDVHRRTFGPFGTESRRSKKNTVTR